MVGEGNGTPLQYSCLENPMDGGAWWAAVHGVAESRTRLSDFTFTFHFHALEKEMATHSSVLAWRVPGWASLVGCVYGVAQSWTQLKRLSSSSSTVVKKHVLDSNDTHGSNSLSFMSYFRWCPRHGSGYKVNLKEFHILRCPQKSSKLDLQVQMSSLCLAHNLSDEQFSPLLKYQ